MTENKGTSKIGHDLALLGGILGIIFAASILLFSLAAFTRSSKSIGLGILLLVLGLYGLASAIMVIIAAKWMKNPDKCAMGGVVALVLSIIGFGTIFGIIGGALGIAQANR